MPTTVFTGTFSPGVVNVAFERKNQGGTPAVNGIDEVTETVLISPISDGSMVLTFVSGGIQTSGSLSPPTATSYDTADSNAASQLLNLDPTKTYTLTITELGPDGHPERRVVG